MHTGRMIGKDKGADQGDACPGQGMPKMRSKPLGYSKEAWDRFSLTALRRDQAMLTS